MKIYLAGLLTSLFLIPMNPVFADSKIPDKDTQSYWTSRVIADNAERSISSGKCVEDACANSVFEWVYSYIYENEDVPGKIGLEKAYGIFQKECGGVLVRLRHRLN